MSLRLLNQEDLSFVLAWRNAPEVRSNMYSKHEISLSEHLAWFARMKKNPQSQWYIHLDTEDKPDGVVYFTQYLPDNRSAFWGLYTGTNAKRGVGTRMEFETLNVAFTEFGIHKLNCEVLLSNIKMLNLQKKFGFVQEGQFRDYHFDGNGFVDVIRLGLLEVEWEAKHDEIEAFITKFDSKVGSRMVNK
jgi:UDP-4-amino-4,6-dideoxy-N-acetyl-beta-L-altrosamine N-acetyltransferase